MGRACALVPQIRNKNGEMVESKLFNDLLSHFNYNRGETKRVYLITKNSDFIKNYDNVLKKDDLGEYTFASLYKNTELKNVVGEKNLLSKLSAEYGSKKNGNFIAYKKHEDAMFNMRRFNNNDDYNKDYIATINSGENGYNIIIEPRTRDRVRQVEKIEYNYRLNEKLREILANAGVSVGSLTELEKRLKINGVTDFDLARNSATGMIELIRLADGIKGEQVLPEEFSHFALAATMHLPLVERMINNIAQNNLALEILGDDYSAYNVAYKGDKLALAKEAAGKLVAQHLSNEKPYTNKESGNLIKRFIQTVKNWIKGNLSAVSIHEAMIQANKDASIYAQEVLTGQMGSQIKLSNVSESGRFYNLQNRIENDKRLLKDMIETTLKKYKIYAKDPNSKFTQKELELIDQLQLAYNQDRFIEGINIYLGYTLEQLKSLDRRLQAVSADVSSTPSEKAKVLRDIRNFLFSYTPILQGIKEQLREEEKSENNRYGEKVRTSLDGVQSLLNDMYTDYMKVSMPIFIDFIKPFVGEALNTSFGKVQANENAIYDLLKTVDKDISFFDRWLDSMAESSDLSLRLMDKIVKRAKIIARNGTLNDIKDLENLQYDLEKAGVKDTEWMYERDENGELTTNLITEIDWAKFSSDFRKFNAELVARYGEEPIGRDINNVRNAKRRWLDENVNMVTHKDGHVEKLPKIEKYRSEAFANLNDAQRKYYNGYMTIKARLDSYLPEKSTNLNRAVQIRKDLVERVKSSTSIKEGLHQIGTNMKEQFIRNSNDTAFGDRAVEGGKVSRGITDLGGEEIHKLPIYYTHRLENPKDLSLDATSALAAYALMANEYHQLNKVVDALELGRELIENREVTVTRGGKPVFEKFNVLGETITNKITKRGDKSNIASKLNDFMESQVYGKYMKDEGTIGSSNIDVGKTANFVNRLTSLSIMALNSLLGISNVATGIYMMNIEAVGGEYFTVKDLAIADKNYLRDLPHALSQIGNRFQTNKMYLFNQKFNLRHDFDEMAKKLNMDRKNWVTRLFSEQLLYFMTNAGEHWMALRTGLAIANHIKLKTASGETISLYDALEVKKVGNKAAKLELIDGVTKLDGTPFTEEDAAKFERLATGAYEGMHGIYNKDDMNAFKRTAVGRMAMMFRNWAISSMNKRYRKAIYNMDLDGWQEGYYRTAAKFGMTMIKELKNLQFNLVANWNELSNHEKANIRRAITDAVQMVIVAVAIGILNGLRGEGDDDDNPWLLSMLEYQMRRLRTETQVFTPWGSVPEGLRILKSPAAGVNTIENLIGVISLAWPGSWDMFVTEVERGRYKGHSKAFKRFMDSPVVPLHTAVYKGFHPEESIGFYKTKN